jgi:hypothetical protein
MPLFGVYGPGCRTSPESFELSYQGFGVRMEWVSGILVRGILSPRQSNLKGVRLEDSHKAAPRTWSPSLRPGGNPGANGRFF